MIKSSSSPILYPAKVDRGNQKLPGSAFNVSLAIGRKKVLVMTYAFIPSFYIENLFFLTINKMEEEEEEK